MACVTQTAWARTPRATTAPRRLLHPPRRRAYSRARYIRDARRLLLVQRTTVVVARRRPTTPYRRVAAVKPFNTTGLGAKTKVQPKHKK